MKIKLPFTISNKYKSEFDYGEVINILNEKKTERHFKGTKIDKYVYKENMDGFIIQRYSIGLDIFSEYYPAIKMKVENKNPIITTIKFIPHYFDILFYFVCATAFISAPFLYNEMTINGVVRRPTLVERFLFGQIGVVIGLFCYFRHIRPIRKTEKWLCEKLKLEKIQNEQNL